MLHIAPLTDRAVIRVHGPETWSFLQGLLTNDIETLAPGKTMWAGMLSPQGKALFELVLHHERADSILIDIAADRVQALIQRLTMYKLRRDVTIEPTDLTVCAAWGGDSGYPVDGRLPELGARWISAAENHPAPAALADYHSHRRALGVPDASEIGIDKTLWLEANAAELNGVSFTKGCYVGQENTARMHYRDKVRRRLLPIRLHDTPQGEGKVRADGEAAGELRTHADGIGIAHLRMEAVKDVLLLSVDGDKAEMIWPAWLERA